MSVEKIIASLPGKSAQERTTIRENAQRQLMAVSDETKANAQAVIDALDQLAVAEHKALYDRLKGMDRAERVGEAFSVHPPTETNAKVIRALLDHPGSTSEQLSAACGWSGNGWHLHFGQMCADREMYLWPAEKFEKRDARFYSGILADFDDGAKTFTMKSDVATAFAALGFKGGA